MRRMSEDQFDVYEQYRNPPYNYQNLGGWLLYWVVIEIISFFITLTTRFNLIKLPQQAIPPELALVLQISSVVSLLVAAGFWVFVILIIKRNSNFLNYYIYLSLFNFVCALGTAIALYVIIHATSISYRTSTYVTRPVYIAIGFFIWTTYFRKSIRVRVYIGSDAYLRKSIFFKRVKDPLPLVPELKEAPREGDGPWRWRDT